MRDDRIVDEDFAQMESRRGGGGGGVFLFAGFAALIVLAVALSTWFQS